MVFLPNCTLQIGFLFYLLLLDCFRLAWFPGQDQLGCLSFGFWDAHRDSDLCFLPTTWIPSWWASTESTGSPRPSRWKERKRNKEHVRASKNRPCLSSSLYPKAPFFNFFFPGHSFKTFFSCFFPVEQGEATQVWGHLWHYRCSEKSESYPPSYPYRSLPGRRICLYYTDESVGAGHTSNLSPVRDREWAGQLHLKLEAVIRWQLGRQEAFRLGLCSIKVVIALGSWEARETALGKFLILQETLIVKGLSMWGDCKDMVVRGLFNFSV